MKKGLAMVLGASMVMGMAMPACAADADLVYAVEAGSAGEAAAEENGFQYNSVASQADALMEVASGTSDAAIIDLLMAGAMIGEGTSYPNLVHTDELTTEEYGVGCRKGSDLAAYINEVFAETYADGSMKEVAEKYGVQDALVEQGAAEEATEVTEEETEAASEEATDAAEDSDVAYIQDKGSLIVGITDFEPMDYKDENGDWIGFDADMASAFAEELGVDVEFVEIDWDNKVLELDGKSIDCVWNGMTLTDEVTSSMECTDAYLNNAQVVVVPAEKADKYQDTDSLKDLSFAVEAGSAGEKQVSNLNLNYTPVNAQADALMEVAAGTSDAAVIDSLMAAAMIGKGTGYADLTYTVSLNSEEYGVGFRKGSDLAAELNKFFEKSMKDGTMKTCAEKYKVQAALIEE